MSQKSKTTDDGLRPEYDFSGGVHGKYYEAYTQSIAARRTVMTAIRTWKFFLLSRNRRD